MAFTPSIVILCLVVFISASAIQSPVNSKEILHEGTTMKLFPGENFYLGQCPVSNLLGHIHCRRRVCLPEELIPLCHGDGDCLSTQKCCTPFCSCRTQCVEAVRED